MHRPRSLVASPRLPPHDTIEAQLAFTRPEDVDPDAARRGLLRARTLDPAAMRDPRSYDQRTCRLRDCSSADAEPLDLRAHGFAHADISRMRGLQAALARIRAAGRITDADATAIRRGLVGRSIPLSGGARLRPLFIAREGLFMRRAGPNGLKMHADATRLGINDHDAAMAVHADQDVDGTPLRQILRGAAPWLFHHDSPDRRNAASRLFLVNLWIPLEQITRPLALMDRRTLDRRAHQLRYGLPTDTFLRRRDDMRVNDIWTFLHEDTQSWYFTSNMNTDTAYVFETLSTPHGSFILPGEDHAESYHKALVAAVAAVQRHDEPAATRALFAPIADPRREPATDPLRRAIATMRALVEYGQANITELCLGHGAAQWCAQAASAAERVVRKSIEMRAVAVLTRAA